MAEIARAVPAPDAQPDTTYRALERLVDETIGVKGFTLMEADRARNVAWRSYSRMPDVYPALGGKPRMQNRRSEIVDGRHETFVANSIEEIAEAFPDDELIHSLGCESCLNLPIIINGELRGTLICLHEAGHFTPDRVQAAETPKTAGARAFLPAESIRNQGECNG